MLITAGVCEGTPRFLIGGKLVFVSVILLSNALFYAFMISAYGLIGAVIMSLAVSLGNMSSRVKGLRRLTALP